MGGKGRSKRTKFQARSRAWKSQSREPMNRNKEKNIPNGLHDQEEDQGARGPRAEVSDGGRSEASPSRRAQRGGGERLEIDRQLHAGRALHGCQLSPPREALSTYRHG